MTIHTEHDGSWLKMNVTFLQFWGYISQQIGNNRLEINLNANSLQDLFIKGSIHPEHLKKLITNSLENQRGSLEQKINLYQLLDELGLTAYALRQHQADDLFDIELLEEIAWHISERFGHLFNTQDAQLNTHSQPTPCKSKRQYTGHKENHQLNASVISISRFSRK